MKKVLLACAGLLALSVSSAQAADVVTEAAYDWSGLYAGLNAGYAFGGDDEVGVLPGLGNIGDLSLNGMFGGVQLGYNHQIDNIVLGLEGDLQFSGISDKDSGGGNTMSDDNDFFGTLRARAGFAVDNTLIYATGGLAIADFDYDVTAGAFAVSDSFTRTGYTIGAGIEHAFDESWSVKLEYLYANFGSKRLTDAPDHTDATPDWHSVRLGVNYHF